jgi:uncharacterized protein (TIGR00255 family)
MTGYGLGKSSVNSREVTVEIRAVNHRYFEFSCRTPRYCGWMDEKLRAIVAETASRGKIEVGVSIFYPEGAPCSVSVNMPLAQAYYFGMNLINEKLDLGGTIMPGDIARYGDVFSLRRENEDEGELWQSVEPALKDALANFSQMRSKEGKNLSEDLSGKLSQLEELVATVEKVCPELVEQYRARLFEKMKEILADKQMLEARIAVEAAVFADKTATDEETVRLKSHIDQMRRFLKQGGAVGRKMDFLVQEMNREANTIGSKAQGIEVSKTIVELKAVIEKIREQVQNIE